jgi:hypothetical protein
MGNSRSSVVSKIRKAFVQAKHWKVVKATSSAWKLLDEILGWDGGLSAVLFPIGWGFLGNKNFPVARIFFTASVVFLALKAISESQKRFGGKWKVLGSIAGILFAFSLWLGLWYWVLYDEVQARQELPPGFVQWLASYFSWSGLIPWRWILLSLIIVAFVALIMSVFVKVRRQRCLEPRLHVLAKTDRELMKSRVRIPSIAYQPHLNDAPNIDFVFSVFNGSLFDVVINNSITGDIWCQADGNDCGEFHYSPKIQSKKPILCGARELTSFTVRQPLRLEELPRFQGKDDVQFGFGTLVITFEGTEQFPEIETTRLETNHCIDIRQGGWRAWDHLGFICAYTEEQWAVLASSNIQSLRTLKAEIESLKASLKAQLATSPQNSPPPESPLHNIQYLRVRDQLIDVCIGDDGYIAKGSLGGLYHTAKDRIKRNGLALIVCYENRPTDHRAVGPAKNISARITYLHRKTNEMACAEPVKIGRGAWLTSKQGTVGFDVSDKHILVLAFCHTNPADTSKMVEVAIERERDGDHALPLLPSKYDVQVLLVDEKEGVPIASFEHELSFSYGVYEVDPLKL